MIPPLTLRTQTMRTLAVIVFGSVLVPQLLAQGLVGWVDQNQQIVLEPIAGRSVTTNGLAITSSASLLIPGTAADPFQFFLINESAQVTLGNLGTSTNIEERTVLDVSYDIAAAREQGVDPCSDLQLGMSGPTVAQSVCTLHGDADFSGTVDFADFLIVSDHFGATDTAWPTGDFDWDGQTGFTDFLLLSAHFGESYPDFPILDGEQVYVRESTTVENDYRLGEFQPEPIAGADPPEYWVDEDQLWTFWIEPEAESDQPLTENDSVTIVAPSVDYGRATHFGVEWSRTENHFDVVSVRLSQSLQTTEFRFPEDYGKALTIPLGSLEAGDFSVDVTAYEIVDPIVGVDFDVSDFLESPDDYELPEGLRWGSATETSIEFQIEAATVSSVPEPDSNLMLLGSLLGICLAGRKRMRR